MFLRCSHKAFQYDEGWLENARGGGCKSPCPVGEVQTGRCNPSADFFFRSGAILEGSLCSTVCKRLLSGAGASAWRCSSLVLLLGFLPLMVELYTGLRLRNDPLCVLAYMFTACYASPLICHATVTEYLKIRFISSMRAGLDRQTLPNRVRP